MPISPRYTGGVSEHDDEEALRWEGEPASNLKPGWSTVGPAKPVHEHTVESTTEVDTVLDLDEDEEVGVTSSVTLVTFGVLAGIFFLYTLGWLTYALRSFTQSSDPLGGFMFNLGLVLAVIAPGLWFGLSFWLFQRPSLRYTALVLGALVLIPVPLVWP